MNQLVESSANSQRVSRVQAPLVISVVLNCIWFCFVLLVHGSWDIYCYIFFGVVSHLCLSTFIKIQFCYKEKPKLNIGFDFSYMGKIPLLFFRVLCLRWIKILILYMNQSCFICCIYFIEWGYEVEYIWAYVFTLCSYSLVFGLGVLDNVFI